MSVLHLVEYATVRVTQAPTMVGCKYMQHESLQVVLLHSSQNHERHIAHRVSVFEMLTGIVRERVDGDEARQQVMLQQVVEHGMLKVAIVAVRIILLLAARVVAEEVQILSTPDLVVGRCIQLPVLDDDDQVVDILGLTLVEWELKANEVHDDDRFTGCQCLLEAAIVVLLRLYELYVIL